MHFPVFLVFVLTVGHGGLRVQVSGQKSPVLNTSERPVFTHKGGQVILNCSVDLQDLPDTYIEQVRWSRADRDQNITVLLYDKNDNKSEAPNERYSGRVEIFSSEIFKGNLSLKLMDVQMEDKGEFICEVAGTRNMSASTVVVLQGVGFIGVHILIFILCSVTLLLAVGFFYPVLNLLKEKDSSPKSLKTHLFLILGPNICMSAAFSLWSTEGFLPEVITCSLVSILRPVMLLKTSTYLDRLSERLQKAVKALAVPVYHSAITMAACSAFFRNAVSVQRPSGHAATVLIILAVIMFISAVPLAARGLRIHLTVCLEIFNLTLFGLLLSSNIKPYTYITEIMCVLTPPIMLMLMVLSLQRLFQGKPFTCGQNALSSVIVTIYSLGKICIFTLFLVTSSAVKTEWMILLESVLFIVAWMVLVFVLHWGPVKKKISNPQWKKIGYLSCSAIVAVVITVNGISHFGFVYSIMEIEDRSGYLALTPLIHILAATCLFKHTKSLPVVPHRMIYMFGAVGLSVVNAAALITELILKAEKGARTIDLRVIVFSLEAVYASAWLALQIYNAWMRLEDRWRDLQARDIDLHKTHNSPMPQTSYQKCSSSDSDQ